MTSQSDDRVQIPFVVPEERINAALTGAIDVWTMLQLEDRAATLAASSESEPEFGYIVVSRPITQKAETVVMFLRDIAKSIREGAGLT